MGWKEDDFDMYLQIMDPAMAIEVAAMSHQKVIDGATAAGNSDIQQFYQSSSVFITGGSGFMGKQMIEKLMRSCKISKIFVLLRPKKGKSVEERLNVMFEDPVFGLLRKQQPDFEKKIVAVAGDAAENRLGISDQDWETLTNEVEVIYHMAATTRFDETLYLATMINVRGTREAISLGRACKKLKSYVHVSTAFTYAMSSLISQEVFEQFYPPPIPPETLISMAEEIDLERLNGLTTGLIQDWPNTYTFTKAVAEELVRTKTENMPVSIVRPGVVICAYKEPSPGWIDISCAYGASGVILGVGLGVIKVYLTEQDTNIGLVPCDYVNNAIIAAGQAASLQNGGDATKIYTVCSNARNPITQRNVSKITYSMRESGLLTPKAVYHVQALQTSNKLYFTILTWLFHFIPAYFVDFVCTLIGKERRFVKIYTKSYKMLSVLSKFSLHDWLFTDDNLKNLYSNLSPTDKIIFNFDLTDIKWDEYLVIWGVGIRKYIVKDGLTNTKLAIRKQFWFRYLHYVVSAMYFYVLFKLFCFFCFLATYLISYLMIFVIFFNDL